MMKKLLFLLFLPVLGLPQSSVTVTSTIPSGVTAGTVAQGNDPRIVGAVQGSDPRLSGNLKSANNLSDVVSPPQALQNLGGVGPNGITKVNGVAFPAGALNPNSIPIVTSPNNISYQLVRNQNMANPFLYIINGTGLSGGGQVQLGGSTMISVKYGNVAGTSAQGNDPRFGIANSVVGAIGVPYSAVGPFGPLLTVPAGSYGCWYDQNDVTQHCVDSIGTISSTIKTTVGGVNTSCSTGSVVTGFARDGTPTCGSGVAPATTGTLFVCVNPSGQLVSQVAACSGT